MCHRRRRHTVNFKKGQLRGGSCRGNRSYVLLDLLPIHLSVGARSSIDSGMSGIPPVPSFPSVRNAFCQSAHRNGRAGLFELPLPTVGPTDILCLRGTMDVPAHISSVRLPPAAGGRKRKETRNICRPALKAVCLCPLPDYCGSGPEDLYSKPASFQNGWGEKTFRPPPLIRGRGKFSF